MSSLLTMILTVILTVVSGVVVFFVCELLKELWLTPLHEYHSLKSKIASALMYFARDYSYPLDIKNADEEIKKHYGDVENELRKVACELSGFTETLKLSWGIPSRDILFKASSSLIGLSNGMFRAYGSNDFQAQAEKNTRKVCEIKDLLEIYYKS